MFSLFISTTDKALFKLVEHLWASLIMPAHSIIWNRNNLPHFSSLYTDGFALLLYKSEIGNTNVQNFFFLIPVKFSTIPGHKLLGSNNNLLMLETKIVLMTASKGEHLSVCFVVLRVISVGGITKFSEKKNHKCNKSCD